MTTTLVASMAGPAAVRLGWWQLMLRIAAGQARAQLVKTFFIDAAHLERMLCAPSVPPLLAGLRWLASLPLALCQARLLARARLLLAAALAEGRPGARAFVLLMAARGQDAAARIAAMAGRLVQRVRQGPPAAPLPRTVGHARPPALAVRPPPDEEARAAQRFALDLRQELIAAEGAEAPEGTEAPEAPAGAFAPEPVDEPDADEPSLDPEPPEPSADAEFIGPPQRLPRNVFELEAYTGTYDPENPPWCQPEWEYVLGHHNGADEEPWDPAEHRPDLPDLAPARPPDDPAVDLAYLDCAVRWRLSRVPEPREVDTQRRQLLAVAGHCFADPVALGHAIREGRWWPPPAGVKAHRPQDSLTIPEALRAGLPP